MFSGVEEVERELGERSSDFWQALFDGQGASNSGLKTKKAPPSAQYSPGQSAQNSATQRIYSDAIVRLLTLQAIIVPQTLPIFLEWLGPINDNKRPSNQVQTSLALQLQTQRFIKSSLISQKKVEEGISYLMFSVDQGRTSPLQAFRLLMERQSIWNTCLNSCIERLENMMHHGNAEVVPGPMRGIIDGLRKQRFDQKQLAPNYVRLGELFQRIERLVLAACCYQAARGVVPYKLYQKLETYESLDPMKPYGLSTPLIRQRTAPEFLVDHGRQLLSNPIAVGGALIALLLGMSAAFIFTFDLDAKVKGSMSSQPDTQRTDATSTNEGSVTTSADLLEGTALPEAQFLDRAQTSFESDTLASIRRLKAAISSPSSSDGSIDDPVAQPDVMAQAPERLLVGWLLGRSPERKEMQALNAMNLLQLEDAQVDDTVRDKWIALIATYQRSKSIDADGYIDPNPDEYKMLEKDLLDFVLAPDDLDSGVESN